MTYDWYGCELPYGVGHLCMGGTTPCRVGNMMKRVSMRIGRKIVWPIMYWTCIASLGIIFSYMNVMYTQVQAGEIDMDTLLEGVEWSIGDDDRTKVEDIDSQNNDIGMSIYTPSGYVCGG